jgi:RNA polymerase sigma-70 factor (ECF subfamily)
MPNRSLRNDDEIASESSLDVDRLLQRLPPKFRTAIRHVKLEGLSVAVKPECPNPSSR